MPLGYYLTLAFMLCVFIVGNIEGFTRFCLQVWRTRKETKEFQKELDRL